MQLKTQERSRISSDDCLRMIKELALMGTIKITLSSDGEPTLHPDFNEIVQAIINTQMRLTIITNLTVLNPSILSGVRKANNIIINLAGMDEESYQRIKAPNENITSAKIISNINTLTKIPKEHRPTITLKYVLTNKNMLNILTALEIGRTCLVNHVSFKLIDPYRFSKHLMLTNNDKVRLARHIHNLLKEPVVVKNNLKDLLYSLIQDSHTNIASTHGHCFVGWFVIKIKENGIVMHCGQNENLIIGNWKKESLKKIWYGVNAQEYRLKAKRIDFENPKWSECRTCHYSNPKNYAQTRTG